MKNELVIGTSNPAKVDMIRAALSPLGLTILSTKELGVSLEIEEDGKTAQENACKKSWAYAGVIDKPVLSMDIALFIDGLSEEEQPGIHTRRIPEHTGSVSDEAMRNYYAALFKRLGGDVRGQWNTATCLIDRAGEHHETTLVSPRKFTSQLSQTILPGFPLASLQIEPVSGKYISELSQAEQNTFWQRVIGKQLAAFVAEALRL